MRNGWRRLAFRSRCATNVRSRNLLAGLRRAGVDHGHWRAVARSRPPPRRKPADPCGERLHAPGKRAAVAQIEQAFERIRIRFWGQRFQASGYSSTTSGNITHDVIENHVNPHTAKNGYSRRVRSCLGQPVCHSVGPNLGTLVISAAAWSLPLAASMIASSTASDSANEA